MNFDDFWKRAAFTNYVQHELGNRTDTQASDCKEEYLVMFEDVLSKLPQIPDVVITWGSIIDKELKRKRNQISIQILKTHVTRMIVINFCGKIMQEKTLRSYVFTILAVRNGSEIKKNGVIC